MCAYCLAFSTICLISFYGMDHFLPPVEEGTDVYDIMNIPLKLAQVI